LGRDLGLGNAAVEQLIAPKAPDPAAASHDGTGSALHDVLGQRDVGNAAAGRVVAQRSAKPGSGTRPNAAGNVDSVLRSPGEQLPGDVARSMEPVVGGSLDGVRIHRDAEAGRSADALDANAYTVGGHVVFGPERYDPGSDAGRSLLAHELTHVAQQGTSMHVPQADSLTVSRPGDRSERAADAVAHRAGRTSSAPHPGGLATTGPVIARQPKDTGTDVKPAPSPTGIQWEDALATMNAIRAVLPNVGPHGIVLPTIDLSPDNLKAMDAATSAQPSSVASDPGTPFPESLLAHVPDRYKELVREWHYIVHPVHVEPNGLIISIYGTMRETHLNMAVAQTQSLVNELATEGEKDSTLPYLSDYWSSVMYLRNQVGQEVIAEATEKAKGVQGANFEELSETEKAKSAVDKATEAAHIAVKVVTQFKAEEIEHAIEHAEHEAERLRKLDEVFQDAAKSGQWPKASLLESAAKMDVVTALVHIEGALHGLSAILAIADPAKREEMLRGSSTIFGLVGAGFLGAKLVLQFAAGATALVGAGGYAVAKLLGKEALAADILAKGVKALEGLEIAISAVMVVHGVLTLLDSEATAEEKEEGALEVAIGATPLIAKITGAFEGGPATLAVVIGFYTFKWIGEAAYGFSVDLAKISLAMCYEFMRREATNVNDDGLHLALALKFWEIEPDHDRKAMFWSVIPGLRSNLRASLADALQHATVGGGGGDREPAYHEPLRKRFAPLATRTTDSDVDLLEVAQEYVHTVAEALAHPDEILEEDVKDMWEKHG
jgi:hypothetical protein